MKPSGAIPVSMVAGDTGRAAACASPAAKRVQELQEYGLCAKPFGRGYNERPFPGRIVLRATAKATQRYDFPHIQMSETGAQKPPAGPRDCTTREPWK